MIHSVANVNIYKCQCSFPDDIPRVPNHAIHMASNINPIFATKNHRHHPSFTLSF